MADTSRALQRSNSKVPRNTLANFEMNNPITASPAGLYLR
jgi:hypothetical protein